MDQPGKVANPARGQLNRKNEYFPSRTCSLKKNLNASRPSGHPPVRGENVTTFRWDHRLQRQNLFMAFKRVPLIYGSNIGSTV